MWKKDPTLAGETLFSTSDRIKMIIEKLESNPNPHTNDLGGCGMDLDSLKYSKGHPLHEYFALHDRYDIRMISKAYFSFFIEFGSVNPPFSMNL